MPAVTPPLSPSPLVAAGRPLTLAVLWGLFMLTSLPLLAGLVQGQATGVERQVLYACATAFLLGMVWRGSIWAWRLTVSFGMVAGFLVFILGMLSGTWVISGVGLGYLVLATALVGTASIRAFLDSRWAARSGRRL
ncbi:hypothetical protein GO986_11450 [Deinococcus sp. HMF7620]|uniref:Uncharacterized protein n=1 Tax=Deinococcus arboris TaxID=2682977 RepID=A0A7C9M923_9DEIO|nr:hypothetical protein [Deinococcus arboris]